MTNPAKPPQLTLDLPHRPALSGDDFLVAACNRDAVAWLDAWPDWPSHGLAIHGPEGCGKTHLAHVFAAQTGACVTPAASVSGLNGIDLAERHNALVVEDCENLADETALFHLLNAVKEAGGTVLITARAPPARWPVRLPDLASRLAALPAIAIQPPDDDLMAALLVKLFADRQLKVGQEALVYALGRMERSFAAARALVAEADRFSLAEKRAVTLPLLRDVLGSRS